MLPIPWWAKIAIQLAWNVLRRALVNAGVSAEVVANIETILRYIGVLGANVTHQEMNERVQKLHPHCSGVACAPELKV
jgi:hypothetical protein